MSRVKLDTPAPEVALPDFSGREWRLSDRRGRANVLLVFNRGFS